MGFALGVIRMSREEFCYCTVEEFEAVCRAYNTQREFDYQNEWERIRQLAAICVQPHCRSKITAKKLMQFPWDNQPKEEPEQEHLTMAERRRRAEECFKKYQEKHKKEQWEKAQ